jgi:hypothetical protein
MQPRSYEPRALPLELPRLIAPFNVQLDNSPAVGIEPTTSEGANASPPRAYRLRHTGYRLLKCLDAPLRCEEYLPATGFDPVSSGL